MLACRAAIIAARSRGFDAGSGRPCRADTVISRISLANCRPRRASCAPFRCMMFLNWECPAIAHASVFSVNSPPTESTLSGHQEASVTDAPGWPGISPRWTSSAKSGVGTALSPVSRVWFTLSHGILDEIYYPRVDQACTRDFGLIVTDDDGFFAEEKRDCSFEIAALEDGVPAFRLVNTHTGGRFRIIKHVLTDHARRRGGPAHPARGAERPAAAPVRPARAASGQWRGAQHRLDRRLQGPPHAVCRGRRHASRAWLLDAVPRTLGRLRRCLATAGRCCSGAVG